MRNLKYLIPVITALSLNNLHVSNASSNSIGCSIDDTEVSFLNDGLEKFKNGDFSKMLYAEKPSSALQKARLDNAIKRLEVSFPDGFVECVTLSTQERSDKFITHSVVFINAETVKLYLAIGLLNTIEGWRVFHITLGYELTDIIAFL